LVVASRGKRCGIAVGIGKALTDHCAGFRRLARLKAPGRTWSMTASGASAPHP
jgi:hypothetical protein